MPIGSNFSNTDAPIRKEQARENSLTPESTVGSKATTSVSSSPIDTGGLPSRPSAIRFRDLSPIEAIHEIKRAVYTSGSSLDQLPGLVQELSALVTNRDHKVRGEACDALGAIGNGKAIEPLIIALHDQSRTVKERAERAIALVVKRLTPDDLPLAYRLLERPDPAAQRVAQEILILQKTNHRESHLEELARLLGHENPKVRGFSRSALLYQGVRAIDPLVRALALDRSADVALPLLQDLFAGSKDEVIDWIVRHPRMPIADKERALLRVNDSVGSESLSTITATLLRSHDPVRREGGVGLFLRAHRLDFLDSSIQKQLSDPLVKGPSVMEALVLHPRLSNEEKLRAITELGRGVYRLSESNLREIISNVSASSNEQDARVARGLLSYFDSEVPGALPREEVAPQGGATGSRWAHLAPRALLARLFEKN